MILVCGATGIVGGAITQALLSQNKTVRILVRQNSNFQPLVEAGAQPVFGDLKDPASLAVACQGVDTLITTANSALRGGDDNPETVEMKGNYNLIEAAKNAGIKHFIFMSALGADPLSPVPFLMGKGQADEQLIQSGMPYTILAPDVFMEVWVTMVVGMPLQQGQPVTLVAEGRHKHSYVSIRDVVAYVVTAVEHPAAKNQKIIIGGAEPLSWQDIVAIYERVYDKAIAVKYVQPGEEVPGLPTSVSQLMATLELFDTAVEMSETSRIYGIKPTGIEEFAMGSLSVK